VADRHELIKWSVITEWSASGKGRLYCMNQGLAVAWKDFEHALEIAIKAKSFKPLKSLFPIWFGPLKIRFKGFSDLFGFEYFYKCTITKVIDCDRNCHLCEYSKKLPIFTAIEVKTKAYPYLSKEQKRFLNFIISIGGMAYIAMEDNSEKGYYIKEWQG